MARSRVRELRLPLTLVFAGSAAIALVTYIALAIAGLSVGTNLGVVGLLLALVLPIGLEIRSRTARPRLVWFLDYRSHHFGQGLASSLTGVLARDRVLWEVEVMRPEPDEPALQWQIQRIQSAIINSVDAVVIIPAAEDQDLWHAMAALSKTGTFLIAIDSKPPNSAFRRLGVEEPRFVSSKYSATGLVIADWLIPWLDEDKTRQTLLWTGPVGSWPGEERSRNIIYALLVSGLAGRLALQPLSTWKPTVDRCREALTWVRQQAGECAIYCADDENALALHMVCVSEQPELRSKMVIIGCNATADDWGNVPVLDMRAADVTVDILVREQGEAAAQMLVRERRGQLGASEQTVFIKPELVVADTSGGWLGRVFQREEEDVPDEVKEVEEVNSVLTEVETLAREPNETTDPAATS
jgi:DNA-binding LacI/PurR family transcriptional regulator